MIDGQQRIRTFKRFFNNEFALGQISEDLNDKVSFVGMKFDDLPSEYAEKFLQFEIGTTEIREAEELQVRELFLRLQEGSTLNPQEKRNAMTGNMRDFIAELSSKDSPHNVFNKINITNKRKEWDDLAALVTCIELSGGPTTVNAKALYDMYKKNESFDVNGVISKKVKQVLNYMSLILKIETPEMNIKWGFVDLYLLISGLLENYVLKGRKADFHEFYVNFEKDRNSQNDDIALLKSSDLSDQDMGNYLRAFRSEGFKKENIEIRNDIYQRRFFRDVGDLQRKDSKRNFTLNERIAIWRRDGQKCLKCSTIIKFEDMQADHKFAWSKGGLSTLDNAQSLCETCNKSKSDK